jgi:hypothetical protein
MLVKSTHKIEMMELPFRVTKAHIQDGKEKLAAKCPIKLAVATALRNELGDFKRVWVDAGKIKFVHAGYRWEGDTPSRARNFLLTFDEAGPDAVQPFSVKVIMRKTSKVQKASAARRRQINEARLARKHAGRPDKRYPHTIRMRVRGFEDRRLKKAV